MSAMTVFMVTLIVTAVDLDIPSGFLWQQSKAFVSAWLVATVSSYFAIPVARRLAGRIIAAVDRAG